MGCFSSALLRFFGCIYGFTITLWTPCFATLLVNPLTLTVIYFFCYYFLNQYFLIQHGTLLKVLLPNVHISQIRKPWQSQESLSNVRQCHVNFTSGNKNFLSFFTFFCFSPGLVEPNELAISWVCMCVPPCVWKLSDHSAEVVCNPYCCWNATAVIRKDLCAVPRDGVRMPACVRY